MLSKPFTFLFRDLITIERSPPWRRLDNAIPRTRRIQVLDMDERSVLYQVYQIEPKGANSNASPGRVTVGTFRQFFGQQLKAALQAGEVG